ncbi:hypothetical protein EXW38_28985 (plasmid) [Bacillus mycoides]|uniref:DUF6037 family protein n=1 Tax=Bacillus mycoides TaxID=1405 RepID=UPI001C016CC4|nr:DUF6037 family protein [Bacillus mycoides]QWH15279.1 hypothetical protein EXW38_28985 [Bacillus mycoides]
MNKLANLKALRDDMKSKDENFDILKFQYKKRNYFVIVEVFKRDEKPRYALAKLIFLRANNVADKFETWAQSNGFYKNDTEKTIKFFGIEYGNIGTMFQSLYTALGEVIPKSFNKERKDERDNKTALTEHVITSDPKDPNKKYCFGVGRTRGNRSAYNAEKTKLLKPELYEALGKYKELSFFYSTDKSEEKDSATIIANFTERNKNR